ncbi:P2X purinoceptor 3 isoform X1 [Lathamus discolor]|uniref:P2X purinoceptor 3 isoform X1 n=1 Tax=Lathamus discolor TaxID=678569 RepID=UPI0032B70E88
MEDAGYGTLDPETWRHGDVLGDTGVRATGPHGHPWGDAGPARWRRGGCWPSRSGGFATWTAAGSAACPATPSPAWTGCPAPPATTSGTARAGAGTRECHACAPRPCPRAGTPGTTAARTAPSAAPSPKPSASASTCWCREVWHRPHPHQHGGRVHLHRGGHGAVRHHPAQLPQGSRALQGPQVRGGQWGSGCHGAGSGHTGGCVGLDGDARSGSAPDPCSALAMGQGLTQAHPLPPGARGGHGAVPWQPHGAGPRVVGPLPPGQAVHGLGHLLPWPLAPGTGMWGGPWAPGVSHRGHPRWAPGPRCPGLIGTPKWVQLPLLTPVPTLGAPALSLCPSAHHCVSQPCPCPQRAPSPELPLPQVPAAPTSPPTAAGAASWGNGCCWGPGLTPPEGC